MRAAANAGEHGPMILRRLTELERQSQPKLRRDEFGQIKMASNWRAGMTAQP